MAKNPLAFCEESQTFFFFSNFFGEESPTCSDRISEESLALSEKSRRLDAKNHCFLAKHGCLLAKNSWLFSEGWLDLLCGCYNFGVI